MEELDFSLFDNPAPIPYHVDVVILIDATGSMDRFFDKTKKLYLRKH